MSFQVGLVGAGLQGGRRVQSLLAEGDRLLIVADTNLWKHFKAVIASRNDDTMEGQKALVVHRLASAIYQSAKTDSLVRL